MRIRDLGQLSGPILLFGGPYSNLQATQALIARAKTLGIKARNCICTGDVVAYCADPHETVAQIRQFGCPVVAGNMEINLGAGATDCGCGFEDGTPCDLMSGAWFAHASANVTSDDRIWMSKCPDVILFEAFGKRCAVIHGGTQNVSRFIWPTSPDTVFEQERAFLCNQIGSIDCIISGHSGVPFVREFSEGVWVNAGVIGMPPHDGRSETRYALMSESGFDICRLSYDAAAAASHMTTLGFTQGYHTALVSGYWPSEDVLPPELRVASLASG